MKRNVVIAAALVMCTASLGSARAEVGNIWVWSNIIPSIAGTDVLGLHLRELRRQDEERARGLKIPNVQPQVGEQSPAAVSLRYVPSKSRRKANLVNIVEKTRAADPAMAAELQKLFAQGDLIESIDARLRPQGLRVDDVADVLTVWWTTVWAASRGNNDTPPRATLDAIRAQASTTLRGSGSMARASDAEKQQLSEVLLLQTVLVDEAVEQAKSDPAKLREVSTSARKIARGMGIDLDAMQLTDKGFVINSK